MFYLFARDASATAQPKTLAENLSVLKTSKIAWILSLFYFLTFGGFVALATAMRPVGGILADKIGGARVLLFVFAAIAGLSLEVITRVLYRLQTQGLIVVEGKDVVISDLESLAGYANSEKY